MINRSFFKIMSVPIRYGGDLLSITWLSMMPNTKKPQTYCTCKKICQYRISFCAMQQWRSCTSLRRKRSVEKWKNLRACLYSTLITAVPWWERQWKGHCFSVRGRTKTPPPDVIARAMKHWQEAPFNCGPLKPQQPLDTCIAEKEQEKESSKVSNSG